MQIEPATVRDCRAIAEVHVQAWQHAYRGIFPEALLAELSIDKRESLWAQAVEQGSPQVLVARIDGQLAGFIAFGASRQQGAAAHAAEIWVINVSPQFWSRGIGKSLMLASRDRLTEQGYDSVSLWVLAKNLRARAFYEAMGLRLIGGTPKDFTYGGTTEVEVHYGWAKGG